MRDKEKVKTKRFFILISFLIFNSLLTLKTLKKVNVNNIRIYGSNLFSKEEIVKNSSLNLPTPLIFVKTRYIEKELKKNLSLKNISVSREILPFGLRILIETRVPIAYGEKTIDGLGITGFIDENGFFIDEKHSDKEKLKQLSIKVFGWDENFKGILSKILKFQKNDEVKFNTIIFSKNGFLTLEEKSLKTILLGFNPKIIETQLEIISNLKKQLKKKNILERIENIDLSDPNDPKIKVFKP